jgi:hypothetical protein
MMKSIHFSSIFTLKAKASPKSPYNQDSQQKSTMLSTTPMLMFDNERIKSPFSNIQTSPHATFNNTLGEDF